MLTPLTAGEVRVAVASNFSGALEQLRDDFETRSGHRLTLVTGSTGKLYAQIRHGAPYDVLLAADAARPERLEQDGLAVDGSRFTYALGRLVLWYRSGAPTDSGTGDQQGSAWLEAGRFRKLAIAHPELAPYGRAAEETMQSLGVLESLRPRLVRGENIAQAYALVASGNAELGFVAQAQLGQGDGGLGRSGAGGTRWPVPAALHQPIRQDAVLLKRATDAEAAAAFLVFLRSEEARSRIAALGYDLP
ncbi:hypothetical protein ABI59_15360 [Acidobacteria bacterium Mor1]|nr:hypothetical protein ABI59_15360 [Acidobacteria bacterium Mor1]